MVVASSASASTVLTAVRPHDPASTIPKLHSASTIACGPLRCGRWAATAVRQAYTRSWQDIPATPAEDVEHLQHGASGYVLPPHFRNLPLKAPAGRGALPSAAGGSGSAAAPLVEVLVSGLTPFGQLVVAL